MEYAWNWGIFFQPSPVGGVTYLGTLLDGLETTVLTALLAWCIAFTVGSAVGIVRSRRSGFAAMCAGLWIEIFRNIPLLLQLFIWYFVVPEIVPVEWGTWLRQLPSASFLTAVVGIGLFMSARVAVQLSAGIAALPRGQAAAAKALGLTQIQTYVYILLPLAYRTILPTLTSEMVNTVKNTSVALAIGLAELTAQARAMEEFSFQIFEAFTAATIGYLLVNVVVTGMAYQIERKLRLPGHAR